MVSRGLVISICIVFLFRWYVLSNRIAIMGLVIQLLILTIKHKKSEDNFGNCDSKYLTEAGVEESYNSLSKGWCKQKRSSKINLQGATVDDLNTCYEETVDDDGYINMVKPNKKCNKSPFGF